MAPGITRWSRSRFTTSCLRPSQRSPTSSTPPPPRPPPRASRPGAHASSESRTRIWRDARWGARSGGCTATDMSVRRRPPCFSSISSSPPRSTAAAERGQWRRAGLPLPLAAALLLFKAATGRVGGARCRIHVH
jgi:hypothetical protein